MPPITPPDFARHIIDFGTIPEDFGPPQPPPPAFLADVGLDWPEDARPIPLPFAGGMPSPDTALPNADILVVTWTRAEHEALADVLTPGFPASTWPRYRRRFNSHYRALIRRTAPAISLDRLGSYFRGRIGDSSILFFKSDLHLNQDGIRTAEGRATLPVKDLWRQIIDEVRPRLVITVGTAGATFPPRGNTTVQGVDCSPHQLGDVVLTRSAKFRLTDEFRNEPFANQAYRCDSFQYPVERLNAARQLLRVNADKLREPAFGPPHTGYDWPLDGTIEGIRNTPDLKLDGRDFPAFHPMLTADSFEFGTSTNGLEQIGCGVEMGDAVLGMVVDEMAAADLSAPRWLIIRNASDTQINGELPDGQDLHPSMRRSGNMQTHWAVWYYESYGYWTSVNSAIAVWAMAI